MLPPPPNFPRIFLSLLLYLLLQSARLIVLCTSLQPRKGFKFLHTQASPVLFEQSQRRDRAWEKRKGRGDAFFPVKKRHSWWMGGKKTKNNKEMASLMFSSPIRGKTTTTTTTGEEEDMEKETGCLTARERSTLGARFVVR